MKSFLLSSLIFIGTLKAQGPAAPPPPANSGPAVATPPATNTGATPPVTAQQPPATAQYGPPAQQPYNPYAAPQYNPYGGIGFMGQLDPQNLNCEFGQCRNRKITMSPGQGFKLYCKQPFQCDGLDLTLNVGHDPTNWGSGISEISDLVFEAPSNGATVRINSVMGNGIEVDNLHCKKPGACRNLKVIAGFGVELWNLNVHCDMPGACTGCTVNGQSCQALSFMNGNNGGYMPYGYGPYGGYTNTPNVGGQPQQGAPPAQGAPPMPQQGVPQYPQFNPSQQWI